MFDINGFCSAKEMEETARNGRESLSNTHYETLFNQIMNAASNGNTKLKEVVLFKEDWINSVDLLLERGYDLIERGNNTYDVYWDNKATGTLIKER